MPAYSHHTEMVDAWMSRVPSEMQEKMHEVRGFLLEWPLTEWYKYQLPMYGIKKNICYLHIDTKTQQPYIGFLNGKLMLQEFPELTRRLTGDQKRVRQYWLPTQTDFETLELLLEKAVLFDH